MNKFFIYIIFVFFFYTNVNVFASEISLLSEKKLNVGDKFKVLISLDPKDALVNVFDIIIEFDKDLVSYSNYKDSDTIIKTWINEPHYVDNEIYLTGIVPGGVNGVYDPLKKELGDIPIIELVFKANKEGNAKFNFLKSYILKNDGIGSVLEVKENNLEIEIIKQNEKDKTIIQSPYLINEEIIDKNPPLPFEIYFINSSLLFKTKDIIAFNTNDKESGIKEYKIKIRNGEWEETKSPQTVSKSLFSKKISVRAYDFSDNWQESTIIIDGILNIKIFVIILILIIFGGIFLYKLLK